MKVLNLYAKYVHILESTENGEKNDWSVGG